MKGDWVEVLVDGGGDMPLPFSVDATKAGRRVEVTTERQMVVVSELTRHGFPVRESRFMASRVIALVEHKMEDVEPTPAETNGRPDEETTGLLPLGGTV